MKGAILYQGVLLASGSAAHKLHTDGKTKELAIHVKEVDLKYKQMRGDFDKKAD